MSKTNIFKSLHLDKIVDNGYGRYPGECVSLVQMWLAYNGFPHEGHGNGEGYRDALVKRGWGVHVDIKNAKPGDIIAGAKGTYGHVAIVLGNGEILDAAGPAANGNGITRVSSLDRFLNNYSDVKVTRLNGFDNGEETIKEKTDEELAKEVLAGKHGNGQARKDSLGSRYDAVQAIVNGTSKPNKKTNEQIASEVKEGKWGNGQARKDALAKAGYDPSAIQKIVNGQTTARPPVSKPKPKPPVSKPKKVNISGKTRLFVSSGGTATYPQVPRKTYDHYTTLKARTVDVLDENALRVRVRIPGFNPERVWINKSELK